MPVTRSSGATGDGHRDPRRCRSTDRAGADPTVSVDDRDTLERAFLRLTPEHRAVFVLHHYAGLPLAEIADIVGVPVGTVKSRLHHATRSLRAAIVADSQVDSRRHGRHDDATRSRLTTRRLARRRPDRSAGGDPAGDLGRRANAASRATGGLPEGMAHVFR